MLSASSLAEHTMIPLFNLFPEAVGTIRAESKAAVLAALSRRFADVYGLDREAVAAGIADREAMGSTGFGRGVAIPHARLAGLDRPVSVFFRLEAPVSFDAADGMPVDLVFGLLSPEHAGAAHLHALASVSRLMRSESMRANLAAAPGAEAIYALLSNVIDRDAA